MVFKQLSIACLIGYFSGDITMPDFSRGLWMGTILDQNNSMSGFEHI